MTSFAECTIADLQHQLQAWQQKPSHAGRILRSYYSRAGNIAWDELRLPAGLRDKLTDHYAPGSTQIVRRHRSADGTIKLLVQLADGHTVECVLMPDHWPDRAAGCISTQVGCAMGCDFCATTQSGFVRNLTSGELVEQFLHLRREALVQQRTLRTLVCMGMGEPMLNLDAVLAAIHRIGGEELGALGWRQLTVSTVGIVPGIDALAAADLRLNLAISLHAPDDATRARLLPTARRYTIAEVLSAADRFQAVSGLPVILQYCLLDGVNDTTEHAHQLAALLAGRRMHVNLLRYNPTGPGLSGIAYAPSTEPVLEAFLETLRANRVVAHYRRPRGQDIAAACGQLRRQAGQS